MDAKKLVNLIENDSVDKIISLFETRQLILRIEDAIKQYDPVQHLVNDRSKRSDKFIYGEGEPDASGNPTKGPVIDTVRVARLTLPIQKQIVATAAAFLGVPKIDSTPKKVAGIRKIFQPKSAESNLLEIIQKVWDDNKLDYKSSEIVSRTLSEKQCAELWYTRDAEDGYWEGYPIAKGVTRKLGMKILSPSLGDEFFPGYDDFGNMIVFIRRYKTLDDDNKEVINVDLYTADSLMYARQNGGTWEYQNLSGVYTPEKTKIPNAFGKIPVIYNCVKSTAWDDVQPLIERLETKISNHADTNDYFDSPILVGTGDTITLPYKGESGKYVEIKGKGGKLEYVTWDQSPESMKMEIDNLREFIREFTATPSLSFEAMKGIGSALSGVAITTTFMGPHFKAAENEQIFGEGVQRRLNFLKVAITKLDTSFSKALTLQLKPKYTYFVPSNDAETLGNIIKAKSAGIMSKETAIRQNPLINDSDSEIEAIQKDVEAAAEAAVVLPNPIGQNSPKNQPQPTK